MINQDYILIPIIELAEVSAAELVEFANEFLTTNLNIRVYDCWFCLTDSILKTYSPTIGLFKNSILTKFVCDKHKRSIKMDPREYKIMYLDKLDKILKHVLL